MRLAALAQHIGARLLGDGDVEVSRVRHVEEAGEGELAFAASAKERRAAYGTKATALLVDESFAAEHAHELPCAVLSSERAADALVRAVEALHPRRPQHSGVDARAVVHAQAHVGEGAYVGPLAVVGRARIGAGARVMPLAYVGDDVSIGDGAVVGVGAVVLDGTTIGARTVVGPGSVVGDEGFVFAPRGDANERLRHVANVVLGDDVDVGANACIDRGALRDTRIGTGARIDNLVQVGHDVQVGMNAVLVAQVGVAGDSVVGDGAILTGQVGVQEHTRIGARARIAGRAAVTRDVADDEAVSGLPLMPHGDWLRAMAVLKRLPELERRVRRLEKPDE